MQTYTFTHSKFAGFCAAAILLASIQSSHASSPSIQLIGTNSGKVATANIKTYDGKTYITGVVYRRTNWSGPHVHIVLVDSKGKAFASKTTTLSGWQGKPSTNHRGSYTASFEPSEVAKASSVQISFLSGLHAFCDDSKNASES